MGRIFSGIRYKKLQLQKAGDHFFHLLCFFIMISALLPAAFPFKAVSGQKNDPPYIFFSHSDFRSLTPDDLASWMDSFTQDQPLKTIRIIEPLPGAILPLDMASPAFVWEDTAQSSTWRITIQNSQKIILRALLNTQWWIPDEDIWEAFKNRSAIPHLKSSSRASAAGAEGISSPRAAVF